MTDHHFTLHNAVDVLLFVVANSTDCDQRLYKQLQWTCLVLLSNNEPAGRLLMQAMTEAGFVFDDDADRGAEALHEDYSETPMAKLQWHVHQLSATLSEDPQVTIARVYNHMVKTCMLPTDFVRSATEKDLKNLVRRFAKSESKLKRTIVDYITENCTGNRRRTARLDNDDTRSVVVQFRPRQRPGSKGAFFHTPRSTFDKIVGIARQLSIPHWADVDEPTLWKRFSTQSSNTHQRCRSSQLAKEVLEEELSGDGSGV